MPAQLICCSIDLCTAVMFIFEMFDTLWRSLSSFRRAIEIWLTDGLEETGSTAGRGLLTKRPF